MWADKVYCLRKQHDGRDWASNHRPSDLKSNALTAYTTAPLQVTIAIAKFCKKLYNKKLKAHCHEEFYLLGKKCAAI